MQMVAYLTDSVYSLHIVRPDCVHKAAGLEQQDPDGRVLGQPPGDHGTGRPGAADDEVVTDGQVGGEIQLVRPNLLIKRDHLG